MSTFIVAEFSLLGGPFSDMLQPLTNLTSNNVNIKWIPIDNLAFDEIK